MKTISKLFILLLTLSLITSCKKSAPKVEQEKNIETPTSNTTVSESIPQTETHQRIEIPNNKMEDLSKPLTDTGWYAFINTDENSDLYGHFTQYAEYNFTANQMEFFINLYNEKMNLDYVMRSDSMFFVKDGQEAFQFTVIERSPESMQIKASTGKVNTLHKISPDALKLSRKERIKKALQDSKKFKPNSLETFFNQIDKIEIN